MKLQVLRIAGGCLALSLFLAGTAGTFAQSGGRWMGEVGAIDQTSGTLEILGASGETWIFQFADDTQFLKVRPGATSLEGAETISAAHILSGDRVLVRSVPEDSGNPIRARQVIVMSRSDIDAKREAEQSEWTRRGVWGTIMAVDDQNRQLTINARPPEGPRDVIIVPGEETQFRRYSTDSVRYADSTASRFEDLKVGDQLRALGNRSEDGLRFDAEKIVTGSFTMAGGVITAIEPDGTIIIDNIPTESPLTVVINAHTGLRQLPEELAALFAQRIQGGGSGGGFRRPPAEGASAPGRRAGNRPAGRPNRNPAGGDLQEMLERLPVITASDLKPGDSVLLSSIRGDEPGKVTAILLLSGVENLLQAPLREGPAGGPGTSLGLPGNVLEFGMELPANQE